jgi:hypothetical protein
MCKCTTASIKFSAREQCPLPRTIYVPVCNDLVLDLSCEVNKEIKQIKNEVLLF